MGFFKWVAVLIALYLVAGIAGIIVAYLTLNGTTFNAIEFIKTVLLFPTKVATLVKG